MTIKAPFGPGVLLMAFVSTAILGGRAQADFTFGQPVNLGPAINSSTDDFGPEISADGLALYMGTDRPGGLGDTDVWVSTRPTKNDEWGSPVHLEGPVNTSYSIWEVSLTADGLQLYFSDGPFSATLPGGDGNGDVWVATRSSTSEAFGSPVILPPIINSDHAAWADVSPDGLELYITSHRAGSIGNCDIWLAKRASKDSPWTSLVNLGSAINSDPPDQSPDICYDGLTLFWAKGQGSDDMDLWMARRKDRSQPFGTGVRLPEGVNTAKGEFGPCLSPDGTVLYFSSNRPGGLGGFDLYAAPVLPIVDFNGDGRVDVKDLLRLIESWGKDDPSVDMGPVPWGDGKVDETDLEVLMSYWGQEVNDPTVAAGWKLNETEGMVAHDIAGMCDGTLHGEPVWQPQGGKIGGALLLDGIDDYISTAFVLNPTAGPFSVFAWVKDGLPGQVIVSQSQKEGVNWLLADASGGRLQTSLTEPWGRFPPKPLVSESVITDGQWHRVGFVWDGKSRALYVDNIQVASDTQTSLTKSIGCLYIGAGSTLAAGTFWSGLIDDVRIYNRAVEP